MSERDEVIPPPSSVRERLARSLREARLLRRQLRLSMQAEADCRNEPSAAPQNADGRKGGE